jgi:hypothetical protein
MRDDGGMSTRMRLLLVTIVVAGLAAQAGGGYALWRGYANRQPTVTDDLPYLDRGIAAVIAAAGGGAAVAVAGIVQAAQCSPAPLISGGEFTRAADMYTEPGAEDALIARITAGLPADYHPHRPAVPDGQTAPLLADAGHDVQLSVRRLGEGWIVASARTHCTTPTRQPDAVNPEPSGDAVTAAQDILSGLGAASARVRQQTLPCPSGGSIVTTTAISQPTTSGTLADRLAGHLPADAHPYPTTANRVAYRTAGVSIIVAASDDATAITVRHTTAC